MPALTVAGEFDGYMGGMFRRLHAAAFATALAMGVAGASALCVAAPVPSSGPGLVQRLVAAYGSDVHGILGMERHFTTVINGGPIHHSEDSDSGLLIEDGAYVRIKYYRIVDDGRPFSASKIAERNKQTNTDWAAGKVFFKEPYDRRYTADYTFVEPGSTAACGAGTVAVNFKSTIRDMQHGIGTMCVQTASERVTKLTYVPNAFPPHATAGSITETSAEVLPGVWYVTRIDETFSGHAFIIHGSATFTGVVDHFKRFATIPEGDTALENRMI